MDYTGDVCSDNFTRGQERRMRQATEMFKLTLWGDNH